MPLVALGLGGNLGGEEAILSRFSAVASTVADMLEAPARRSAVYRSNPMGPVREQPRFLNAALAFESELAHEPMLLLAALLDLEALLGRVRGDEAFGPREIDIDFLLWDDEQLSVAGPLSLQLPHPGIADRDFVLSPLIELLGDSHLLPGVAAPLGELRARLADQGVRRTPLKF